MARTIEFYSGVLGMPLIKALDPPDGMGQHFFFDAGNGDCIAFFWFADAPDGQTGETTPAALPGLGAGRRETPPRRLHPVVLFLRPRRHHVGVRLLDEGVQR